MITIDLKQYIQNKKVLSGRDNGINLRKKLEIDKKENENDEIKILIPKEVFALNSSYFLGWLGKSVRKLGKEKCEKKYHFECNEVIKLNIEDGINDALNNIDVFGG